MIYPHLFSHVNPPYIHTLIITRGADDNVFKEVVVGHRQTCGLSCDEL